jgi:TPR repeat protein
LIAHRSWQRAIAIALVWAWPVGVVQAADCKTALAMPLPVSELRLGQALEEMPAGKCLVAAAKRGDGSAAMRLADFYRENAANATYIDVFGREIEWYRRAAALGIARANLVLMRVYDRDISRQIPDTSLAYAITAIHLGVVGAAHAVARAYREGRIQAGKLYFLRQWLNGAEGRRLPERKELLDAFSQPAPSLRPE